MEGWIGLEDFALPSSSSSPSSLGAIDGDGDDEDGGRNNNSRRRRLCLTNSRRSLLTVGLDSHYWFLYNKLLLLSIRDFWKELLCCWSLSKTIIFVAGYNGCKVEGVAWVGSLVGVRV
jgi:hypothetical protein